MSQTAVQLESPDVTQSSSHGHLQAPLPVVRETSAAVTTKSVDKGARAADVLQARTGRRYRLLEVIGKGGFGMVYRARCLSEVAPLYYALKSEKPDHVGMEAAVLSKVAGQLHFCRLVDRGVTDEGDKHFLVMTLVGPSLSMLRDELPNRRFSLSTAIRVCMQMLFAIEQLHKAGFVSRDVKPSNFTVGSSCDSRRLIYMLDFGISKHYRDANGEIIPPGKGVYRGTTRYCSINSHKGVDQSRRDDLESWFYSLMELSTGRLPWSHIPKARKDKVCREKQLARGLQRTLFLGDCPREYHKIMDAIDYWNYFAEPDYLGICIYLTRVTKRLEIAFDEPYDWEDLPAYERFCEALSNPPKVAAAADQSVKSLSAKR